MNRSTWIPATIVLILSLLGLVIGRWSDAHMNGWHDLSALPKLAYWAFYVFALGVAGIISLIAKKARAATIFFTSLFVLGGGSALSIFVPDAIGHIWAKHTLEGCAELAGWRWSDGDAGFLTVTASVRRGTAERIVTSIEGEYDISCAGAWQDCQVPLPPGAPGSVVDVSAKLRRRHPMPFQDLTIDFHCPTGTLRYGGGGPIGDGDVRRPLPPGTAIGPSPTGWQLITKRPVAEYPAQFLVRPASFDDLPTPIENDTTALGPGDPVKIGQWLVGDAVLERALSQVPKGSLLTWWRWYGNAEDRIAQKALSERIRRAHPGVVESGYLP